MNQYKIYDEPLPGPYSNLAVNPIWPFIGVMFAGIWLSWTWFLINGMVVGSPTQRKESTWIIAGLLVSVLLVFAILWFVGLDILPKEYIKYAVLGLTVWQLGVTYVLFSLQSHTIELYEYYGGVLRNGLFVVVAAVLLGNWLFKDLPPLVTMVLT
ncbi:MAG: hypothetical protein KZQ80_02705 [Candidatus Thiodiazotropha sp. (ex Monitilora ramsayi)]|nr:hypothetical protein [Candidatus Thiodiazotropha sp. (ex Monitilora ramsayi)]